MCRKEKFSNIAFNQARLSTLNFKHGAIITKGSKIIVTGRNYGERTKILGQIHSCIHAEISVASQLINRYIRKKTTNKTKIQKILKKYTIWVVRIPRDSETSNTVFKNSIPCEMCIKKLLSLGFNKIAYSNDNGTIEINQLKNLKRNVFTSAQKRYKQFYS